MSVGLRSSHPAERVGSPLGTNYKRYPKLQWGEGRGRRSGAEDREGARARFSPFSRPRVRSSTGTRSASARQDPVGWTQARLHLALPRMTNARCLCLIFNPPLSCALCALQTNRTKTSNNG